MMPEEAVRFSFTGCLTAEVYRRALYVRLRKLRRVYAALAAAVVPLGILTRNIVCLCAGGAAVWSLALRVAQFRRTDRLQQNLPYTTVFTDTALVSQTKLGETRVPYELLYRVMDAQALILVMLSKNQMLVLEERCITGGDPKDFFSFLCDEKRVPYEKG